MAKKEIHIGQLIRQKLNEQERSIAWLARQIDCHPNSLPRKLEKSSLDIDLLCRISLELDENFLKPSYDALQDRLRSKKATK
jgi:hypothetical protein